MPLVTPEDLWNRRVLLAGVVAAAALSAGPARADVVNCHDPQRGIVQSKRAHACDGEVVSDARAREIREERQRRRLRALRPNADTETKRQPEPAKGRVRSGSGFPVDASGHVITARHVVEGCREIRITTTAGAESAARVVARSDRTDLAVLKTGRALLPPVPIPAAGAHNVARSDERVTAIGYPEQGLPRIRPYRVRGPVVEVAQRGAGPPVIAFRAEVRRGNSGGPLFGADGRLLGVVVAKLDTPEVYRRTGEVIRNLAFAYTLESVRTLLAAAEVPIERASAGSLSTAVAEARTMRVICRAGPEGGA
jgi:S1-C subfamily serine protease